MAVSAKKITHIAQAITFSHDWKMVQLGDVATINPKLPVGTIPDNRKVQFLPMKLVAEESGKIQLTETRTYGEVKKGYTSFVDGDVIFAKVTPCMENGKIAVVGNLLNGLGFGSTEFHVLRTSGLIDPQFLFYFLVQSKFRKEAANAMTGAVGLRRVPKQFMEQYLFMLPSVKVQQEIVSKIEELFSELDKGIESLKLAQEQLKVYRQAVLKWAFEGRLTNEDVIKDKLPKGWQITSIDQVAEINPKLPNRELLPDRLIVQFIPMKLVEENINKIHLTEKQEYREVKQKSYTPFIDKDILFAKVTPCMENGKIAIADNLINGIGFGSSEFHVLRCFSSINNKYLFFYLVQERFRSEAENAMTGAVGLRRVPRQFIEKNTLPLPPLSKQIEIVSEVEGRLSVIDKMEETINQGLQQAAVLRQSILKSAFKGNLIK